MIPPCHYKKLGVLPLLLSLFSLLKAQEHADCITAMEICKKQTYRVQQAEGEGKNNKEADFVACFLNGDNMGQAEENATWIRFEIKESGTLAFSITPNKASDDIDFVVFRLPGNGSCSQKQIVRCMAAGDKENTAANSPCMGKTGLREGEKDSSEDAGCSDADDNAWLAPLRVVQGEKYVVLVSNVSTRGPGFEIKFSGTAKLPCDALPDPPPAPVKTPKVAEPAATKPAEIRKIRDREVRITQTTRVKSRQIKVRVWDNQYEDGDVISLYLNEKKVISNIRLTTKPQEFQLSLEGKENLLTVYAEDFGIAEPNTASVEVDDGKNKQTMVLKAAKGFQESVKVVVE
jgi:hypothetical protein